MNDFNNLIPFKHSESEGFKGNKKNKNKKIGVNLEKKFNSEFAKNFIKKYGIDNARKNEEYKKLSLQQKEAIRYQLKKIKNIPEKEKIKKKITPWSSVIKNLIKPISFLCFLLIEILVFSISKDFYQSIGLPLFMSVSLAFLIEFIFLASSSMSGFFSILFRLSTLFLSIFTLIWASVANDPSVKRIRQDQLLEEESFRNQIIRLNETIGSKKKEKEQLIKTSDIYLDEKMATKATKEILPKIKEINLEITSYLSEISLAEKNLRLVALNSDISFFQKIKHIREETIVFILVIFLLQLFIAVFFRKILFDEKSFSAKRSQNLRPRLA